MTRERFWSVVEGARGDEAALEEALAALPPEEIFSFDLHFRTLHAQAFRWDLWGAAALMEGGCSAEGFAAFRNALIGLGRGGYQAALADPDALCEAEVLSSDALGEVADEAYQAATGERLPRAAVPEPEEPAGEPWDFERRGGEPPAPAAALRALPVAGSPRRVRGGRRSAHTHAARARAPTAMTWGYLPGLWYTALACARPLAPRCPAAAASPRSPAPPPS